MAIGKASDFVIYEAQFNGGLVETLTQNTDAFNAASRGAISLRTRRSRGNYLQESFFSTISSLVSRRDTTSVSSATDLALTQDEIISVKLNRTVGPVAQTLDAFRKIQRSLGGENGAMALSFLLGTQVAKAMQVEWLNKGLLSGQTALVNTSDVFQDDRTTGGTLTTAGLVRGLAKFGDAADRIILWVMHSKAYYDLVQNQISANVDGTSNFNIATGTPVTMNRPVLITDSSDLTDTTGSPTGEPDYITLGLTANGIVLEDSEEETMHQELVTGLDNLVVRLQGEFAFNCGVKGYKWDTTNGGANPTDATLGTGSNWDQAAADKKDLAGIAIKTN